MEKCPAADEFLPLAEESGVVARTDLDQSFQTLMDRGIELNDARTLANSAVSIRRLTPAEKPLERRHQGFLLGQYRLLSLPGKGSMGLYTSQITP